MRKLPLVALVGAVALAGLATAVATLTAPEVRAVALPAHEPDPANGRTMFFAGGCLSCHAPTRESGIDETLPAGGAPLKTPFGAVYPPNLTPHATGLGGWTVEDFIRAMRDGVTPGGGHLLPAFPYASYRHMKTEDLVDLWAHLRSLEPVASPAAPRAALLLRLARPFIGVWKRLAFAPLAVPPDAARGDAWNRGAYLVQGPGHCGECHTPRNLLMVMDNDRFLAGGPHPEGRDKVPSLHGLIGDDHDHDHGGGGTDAPYKSVDDLTDALRFGETLGYEDLSSGGMAKVQENIGRLPEADARAIAVFLASLE